MTKVEMLALLRLLSALESWSFATKHELPKQMHDTIDANVKLLEQYILGMKP